MVLSGKLSTEVGIKTPADKFYNLFITELHEVQNLCERVHHTKLHEGEDWHHTDSVKHWTYVIDGKVHTCHESLEEVDEQNKKIIFKLFGGDIDEHYKVFKLILEVIDKGDGTAASKWTVEYEKINEDIDPPNGYMEYFGKCARDIDNHLAKAKIAI
ncbi:putative START-like domain-containing protein [Medicago truncatula]|uniref:Pathogenesis-related protein bet V I family protein n=1 Tax=Medicago truncatula TaxID=3880 RepID=G7L7T5_MEDTR|nr:MLP-like protein 43 [Medicago truncatula]AET02676.1 pathogenesis-related protein bet V I family protein [Medicago truncatula]RHN40531.1 putative START-like domain-containing protein [Medicago truncatula]